MKLMQRTLKLAAITLMLSGGTFLLNGCNTVEGVGHDFSAMGQTLADVAANTNPEKK